VQMRVRANYYTNTKCPDQLRGPVFHPALQFNADSRAKIRQKLCWLGDKRGWVGGDSKSAISMASCTGEGGVASGKAGANSRSGGSCPAQKLCHATPLGRLLTGSHDGRPSNGNPTGHLH